MFIFICSIEAKSKRRQVDKIATALASPLLASLVLARLEEPSAAASIAVAVCCGELSGGSRA